MAEKRTYSLGEEIAHSVTHGIGILIGIAVLVLLVVFASHRHSAWEITSVAIYGTAFIMLYLGSTLYHAITNERAKRVLKVVDHSAIYLLIAGTYTPYALCPLRGPLGWSICQPLTSISGCKPSLWALTTHGRRVLLHRDPSARG